MFTIARDLCENKEHTTSSKCSAGKIFMRIDEQHNLKQNVEFHCPKATQNSESAVS